MIGQDPQAAQTFLHAWDTLTGATAADNLLRETITDAGFPGALLFARSPDGLPVFYATAQDARSWHRLAPLLTAFAGLTTTDFRGPPSNVLNHQDPLENLIASSGCHAVARLRVTPKTATLAERSLRRLYLTWRQAPSGRQALFESTGTLVSRFYAALATFDAATARALLTQLEQERRLDALNLNFLEIALRSALGDRSGLLALDCLPYVLAARRPPAVSVAIAEAVWCCVLAPVLESSGIDAAMALYRIEARPLIAVLGNVPRNAAPGVFALMAVAVLAGDLEVEALAERLGETGFDILPPSLAQAVRERQRPVRQLPATSPLATARAALLKAVQDDSLEACRLAQQAVAGLNPADQQTLLAQLTYRTLWHAISIQTGDTTPSDWVAWIERLSQPEFTQAFAIAERAVAEWRVWDQLSDPLAVQRLADSVTAIPTGIPIDRFLLALPLLVGWLRDDERFPVTLHTDLYLALLTVVTLHGTFGEDKIGVAAILYEAALSCGLDVDRYRDVLDLASELVPRANGLRYIDWLLDWASLTLAYPVADVGKRQQLLHQILEVLRPSAGSMQPRQSILFAELARALGLPNIPQPVAPALTSTTGVAAGLSRLAGKIIAIYTLTESAGCQAAVLLQQLVPNISVELSHDKVGNERLQMLARNADLFVVVTQSAKHAATLFIQRYRQSRPLLFPKGRGVSSILAALEEFCVSQQ